MTGGVTIRPLEVADLPAVTRVHLSAFPRSALTKFGPGLIARYYAWQLTGPHDVASFGAFEDFRLIGFVVANRFAFALRLATRPWLLGNSLIRERLVRAWRWAFHSLLPPLVSAPRDRTSLGVLVLAVDPAAQHVGVGRGLLRAVEVAADERGLHHLHLTVDPANVGATGFYERSGWDRVVRDGVWEGAMEKELPPQGAPGASTES